jgi:hypothetical protein
MKSFYLAGTCVASIIAFNMVAFAQTTASQAAASPALAAQQTTADQQVTITGCVQRETDYRRARDAGRGGVAGTGVGAANEFVLINASMGSASGTTGTTGAAGSAPTGTTGAVATGAAYELTGTNERQAAQYVGQRVEISGKLKAAEVGTSGRPTGGETAGKPPEGIEIAG